MCVISKAEKKLKTAYSFINFMSHHCFHKIFPCLVAINVPSVIKSQAEIRVLNFCAIKLVDLFIT